MKTIAFQSQIYLDYREKVLSYLYSRVQNHDLAEDLCQDVFVKAYENADAFDESKASVSTWLYTITKNTLIDYYRTRKVTGEIPDTLRLEQDVEDEVISADMLDRLSRALSHMDERQRDIIILRYYDGMKLRDIAQRMGISYAYIKVLLNKSLDFLKNNL